MCRARRLCRSGERESALCMLWPRRGIGEQQRRLAFVMWLQHSVTVRMLTLTPQRSSRRRTSCGWQRLLAAASVVSIKLASWEISAAAAGGVCMGHTHFVFAARPGAWAFGAGLVLPAPVASFKVSSH